MNRGPSAGELRYSDKSKQAADLEDTDESHRRDAKHRKPNNTIPTELQNRKTLTYDD